MTNAVSKLHSALETWSFKYNCYEAVHPWTPFCTDSALEVGLTVFGQAIKVYTPLYLFSQLARRKYDLDSFKLTSRSILRSTSFISANAFFALFFFCSSQYLTGKFYYYAVAYLPAFLASAMAVMIEKPSRRSTLAFYVANVASEALFRICVGRGYLRPVANGQVYIFALAMATTMMLAKERGFEDDPLSAAIRLIVGAEEAGVRRSRRQPELMRDLEQLAQKFGESEISPELNNNNDAPEKKVHFSETRLQHTLDWIRRFATSRHRLCPHRSSSCLAYAARASARALAIGYAAQLGLRLLLRAPQIAADPTAAKRVLADTSLVRAGLFLSAFSGVYKASNCCLRWSRDSSTPLNCFLAGLAAGPALLIYPSPTVAQYVLWKSLETLLNEAARRRLVRHKDLLVVLLYGLATSQLFYSALMDPRYMKRSYMAFLDRISEHKLHMINRSVLDVFGTQASSGYEDYFPDLHPKFMSRAFLGSIWVWMIEQKIVANQLPSF